ncbi:DMP19 family protein [Flexithrix dorotheae]|uniref:DMP19 family protein n=1 Tax=Flexithrix dorotheae TaxID=70993 RepID=UPI000361F70D|nr:hypothetical protein [Flexithrix dorotheae]
MDKAQKKLLKQRYKDEQRKNDPGEVFSGLWLNSIREVDSLNENLIDSWTDEEIEWKIVCYAFNQIEQENHCSERENLLKLPTGVQAIFATYLFESSISLDGNFYNFFFQSNGAFTRETYVGYDAIGNREMYHLMEQCIGAYFKLVRSGEVKDACGIEHDLDLDEDYFIKVNEFDLDELAQKINEIDFEVLKRKKVAFIRDNKHLF